MRTHAIDFASRFCLRFPSIIQAPMAGGITTPKLVAAVSNANGLGSFATGYLTTEQVQSGIREIKQLTKRPFIANLFIPNQAEKDDPQIRVYQNTLNKFRRDLGMKEENASTPFSLPKDNFDGIIEVLLSENVPIVSFTFGNLEPTLISRFKERKIYLIGTATSLEEAKILSESGIDAIVAQGHEAGGHRGGFFTPPRHACVGTIALVPQLVNNIERPIIAAGGIMEGRSIAAVFALGAAAVQMGTAFLTTEESGANQNYQSMLRGMKKHGCDMTTLTAAYSGKMARGIVTEFINYMEEHIPSFPPYPIPNILSTPVRREATKQNATHIMSMWSGQGTPLIRNNLTAAQLLEQLHDEFVESIKRLSSSLASCNNSTFLKKNL
ncbi:MAG: 2-nitropropane dioxygenase NPD [uncultured bacterium]|nr:MAG: 2-nitropropane dioxygenase NPD [uncultured bacterium]OGT15396.1 MAG: hypothetical protein A3B69_01855 [Gammaproteobacteria bacterium RIFCSPHIGHO2_02_FULL_38_33]OGT23584.1 MAG: hypothetical protein A2W47_03075 [Gammaproteobacteria bacterium RIFCSPHIGHO2_12_38_15]OGT69360.1 MAG: hypothetical protein A3I12_05645 [Gammaproteobacteria bacterium RIFCSPLOWO2_02_FULL_38_11]OGT77847.1 MAG: hypothetical protein A3G71_03655 [Gammaproteobacteria bacterium RIFCSPLOWO2_12_FULL_38_14]